MHCVGVGAAWAGAPWAKALVRLAEERRRQKRGPKGKRTALRRGREGSYCYVELAHDFWLR